MFTFNYIGLATLGMLFSVGWGIVSLIVDLPFMTPIPIERPVPWVDDTTTAILFDIGVYLTIMGSFTTVALLLADEVAPSIEEQPEEQPHASDQQYSTTNGHQGDRAEEKPSAAVVERSR
jgi:hypothetical protein